MRNRKLFLALLDYFYLIITFLIFFSIIPYKDIGVPVKYIFVHFVIITLCVFFFRMLVGVYSRTWRYASYMDYIRLIVADVSAGIIYYCINRFTLPYNITFIRCLGMFAFNAFAAVAARCAYQYLYTILKRNGKNASDEEEKAHAKNIAIVGAGRLGAALCEEIHANKNRLYEVYCFFDRDKDKIGSYICGKKVYPADESTVDFIKNSKIDEIVIAVTNPTAEMKTDFYNFYSETGLPVKLYDFPFGAGQTENTKRFMRDIKIEDLLFRDSIPVGADDGIDFYTGKTVLVTGGGGSIGSELCRQIAAARPKKLVILDIYENNAYDIQQELVRNYGKDFPVRIEIASVRDREKIDSIFHKYHPEIVFHAAAHKHVHLMEYCPAEAIKNNVFGTLNVVDAAEKYGTKKFIQISTDKAVNPTNIMGASKRVCEMIIQSRWDSQTDFTAVRFGNVLGSNGSVIPLFKHQIENGGPVTITDKRIIRYFMTIPEAVQLLLITGEMAKKSEIFVLDMGKPVKIIDLAEQMIKLSGFRPYEDIKIVETGLRPGEKLYEELLIKSGEMNRTDNELIFVEKDEMYTRENIDSYMAAFRRAIDSEDDDVIRSTMMKIVTTFHDADFVNKNADESDEMNSVNCCVSV